MKRSSKFRWTQINVALSIVVVLFFLFSNNVAADNVITGNLQITPSPNVSPGTQLSFKGTIFNNPAFSDPPGTRMRCWVVQPDFSRATESVDIDSPAAGQQVTLNFAQKFTIPSNAKPGKIYDFFLVYGIYYPLSAKSSVKVTLNKLQIKQINKAVVPTIKKPGIVVKSFAYSPAPLKEGAHINMYIIFENKGLGKSSSNAKYQIKCDIISGGGPLKKCPVPSTEMTFGKEILPGKTHSVNLLGAIPAEAGQYKISIIIPGTRGRPYSQVLKVAKKINLKFKKVPAQNSKDVAPGSKRTFNPQPEPPRKVKQ